MERARLIREIEAGAFSGLRPRKWLCVGAGFSREEVKGILLARGGGLTGQAVSSPETLALAVIQAPGANDEVPLRESASASTRQEGLRFLISDSRVSAYLPELKKLKRQGQFYRRLDQAVQGYRLASAHAEEAQVFEQRLQERAIRSALRPEVAVVSVAFEAWLAAESLLDPPVLFKEARQRLAQAGAEIALPEEIVWLSARRPEGLEAAFWDELGRRTQVTCVGPAEWGASRPAPTRWERWHTIDDAAEALAQTLLAEYRAGTLAQSAVLIPDQAGVRRSLRRALDAQGVPLADPRDPNRLKWDESIKRALLPLEVVARDFERSRVISYLANEAGSAERELASAWTREINARGLRRGLSGYAGGRLSLAYEKLERLSQDLGGRKTALQLAQAHLRWLREHTPGATAWIVPFFETLWRDFVRDAARVGQTARQAPALFWWERFQARVTEAPAPVERLKPQLGVEIYRFHQAALRSYSRVHVLGVGPCDLDEAVGDYAYTEREREALGADFMIRSRRQGGRERLATLHAWVSGAEEVTWLDAHYAADGRELESAEAVISQMAGPPDGASGEGQLGAMPAPVERGAHARWRPSFSASRPLPSQVVTLPRGPEPLLLTATAIEAYSRCPFIALSDQKWRLFDGREPDADLWPDARGNILHRSVRLLLESRTPEGQFALGHREALEAAWAAEKPRGLMRSPRVIAYVKARLLETLETFVQKERVYFDKVRPKTVALDNRSFELRLGGGSITIKGTPDRIDQIGERLWVMDYKTSSAPPPHGTEMIELGYRMQLPFYGLAVAAATGLPVMGLQFVSLTAAGARSSGVFFKSYNGKEPGKPTELRANSKSLLATDPDDAWARALEHLETQAQAYARGEFSPTPRRGEKECATCRVSDLCGFRRLS